MTDACITREAVNMTMSERKKNKKRLNFELTGGGNEANDEREEEGDGGAGASVSEGKEEGERKDTR